MSATPPDSGERRVIRALRKQAEATKREADRMRIVELPLSFVQRILAALEKSGRQTLRYSEQVEAVALADELRKVMGK